MLASFLLGIFTLAATEASALSKGDAQYTDYYSHNDIGKNINYLKGNFTNSFKDTRSINGEQGLSYGEGQIKILILGGLSGCPLCTLQVFEIADILGSSIRDNEKTERIFNYTTIDMYPMINKHAYETMLDNFEDQNKYIEIKGEGINISNECPDGIIPDCSFASSSAGNGCCGNSKIANALIPIINDYDIIINIQGFGKNRILHPYSANGNSLNKQNETMYNYLATFFKDFSAESSYDRFGSKSGSLIDYAYSLGKTVIQMEIGTLNNKFFRDNSILRGYADSFLNDFLMKGASIPSALINDIWVSRGTDSNERYTIRANIAIQNRYPFILSRTYRINIISPITQDSLNFQFTTQELSYIIDSLYDSVEVEKLNIYPAISSDKKGGALITQNFLLPAYAKIEADFYFFQGQSNGGNYSYSIQMQEEIGSPLELLENFTSTNPIKEELKTKVMGKLPRGIVLLLMFIVFVIVMLAIVCCVLIKHKPGSLLA